MQKQQEAAVAAAGASISTMSKVNAAARGEVPSVNGQANAHTDSPEKELDADGLEEALENGPKGTSATRFFFKATKSTKAFMRIMRLSWLWLSGYCTLLAMQEFQLIPGLGLFLS